MSSLKILVKLLLVSILFFHFAEKTDKSNLNAIQLTEDVNALRSSLEKYHPGLYWYTSKSEFDSIWDILNNEIRSPKTKDQFFKLLLPIVASVQCAHTLFIPSGEMISSGSRFPLNMKFIDGKGYIMTDSSAQHGIPNGSELLSINGVSMENIINTLLPNLQAQGGNLGWKFVILENDFHNYYYYVIGHTDTFEIEYIDHATLQKVNITINGSTDETLLKHWKNWYPTSSGPPLQIKYIDEINGAVITVKSFSRSRYREYHQNFEKLIDTYFSDISKRGIENLIIDLRGNEGGSESTQKLYSYLSNKESPGNRFNGKVILLTNRRSISAQETFISLFKYHKRGFTVGEPTPGCQKGLCGGKKHRLFLPNSLFEITIPMHKSTYLNAPDVASKDGEGYSPDFLIKERIEDTIAGKDAAMEFAVEKLR